MDWKLAEAIAWGVAGAIILYFRHPIANYSSRMELPKFRKWYGEDKDRDTKMSAAFLYWPTAIGVLGIINAFLVYFGQIFKV
jgi:hypothetical protein